MGTPFGPAAAIANGVTWPQCGPIACWTPLVTGMPFWLTMCSSCRGCQRFGSAISIVDLFTTRGSLTGL